MKRNENRKEIISNPRRNLLRAATVGAIGLANPLFGFAVESAKGNPQPLPPLVFGQLNHSVHQVAGEVARLLLQVLGYEVEVITGGHSAMYTALANNRIDVFATAWLPQTHAVHFSMVSDKVEAIGEIYPGHMLWGVPDYVPESEVKTVDDLRRKTVSGQMTKTLHSIGEAAALTQSSRQIVREQGLEEAGFSVVTGTEQSCFAAFEAAVDAKRWVVAPLWHPNFLHGKYRIRELTGLNKYFEVGDTARFLVSKEAIRSKLSAEAMGVLGRININSTAVSQMDALVNLEQLTPFEAAHAWLIDHPTEAKQFLGITTEPAA
jgi:glycine betaine/proline transport system substrate-binding protein